jgi:hypothetical protein
LEQVAGVAIDFVGVNFTLANHWMLARQHRYPNQGEVDSRLFILLQELRLKCDFEGQPADLIQHIKNQFFPISEKKFTP